MEDVDRLIVRALQQLQCSFFKQEAPPTTLSQLGGPDVIEGIVRCLWACDSATTNTIPSYALPPTTTGRFKLARSISAAIKAVGVAEDFGYEVILYHSIFDVRRVFLALLDKLPKETISKEETDRTPMALLREGVGAMLRVHLQSAQPYWVPDFCHRLGMNYHGRLWHPADEQPLDYPYSSAGRMRGYDNRGVICSILGSMAVHLDGDPHSVVPTSFAPSLMEKPKLAPKPKDRTNKDPSSPSSSIMVETDDNAASLKTALTDNASKVAKAQLDAQIAGLQEECDMRRLRLSETQRNLSERERELEMLSDELGHRDLRLHKLIAETGIEEAVEKLRNTVSEASVRQQQLQEHFIDAKSTKEHELKELALLVRKDRGVEHVNGLQTAAKRLAEEVALKAKIKAKLEKKLASWSDQTKQGTNEESLKRGRDERLAYVKRIREMAASINKQNDEIIKTVKLVRKLEHEVHYSMAGTLSRCFIAVDRWLRDEAIGDVRIQKAHRLLTRFHEQCGILTGTITQMGQLNRQISGLENEIELASQKMVDSRMAELIQDLMQLRSENDLLTKKLSAIEMSDE